LEIEDILAAIKYARNWMNHPIFVIWY
jgi:hypothetical protein